MAATVTVSESNGSGETVTASITNSNMGSTDAVNLVASNFPITAGGNSYEKWQRFRVSDLGGSYCIKNLRVWASAALAAYSTHKTNARESAYDGAQTYGTPSASDRSATYDYTQTMPIVQPTLPNLGIGGSLAGEITTAVPTFSDYLLQQIQTTASAVVGKTITMNYQYDEIA